MLGEHVFRNFVGDRITASAKQEQQGNEISQWTLLEWKRRNEFSAQVTNKGETAWIVYLYKVGAALHRELLQT